MKGKYKMDFGRNIKTGMIFNEENSSNTYLSERLMRKYGKETWYADVVIMDKTTIVLVYSGFDALLGVGASKCRATDEYVEKWGISIALAKALAQAFPNAGKNTESDEFDKIPIFHLPKEYSVRLTYLNKPSNDESKALGSE